MSATNDPVDLDRVHRRGQQPGQGAVAGAEVVQGQPHAQRPQPAHHLHRGVRAVAAGDLGHLQGELGGRQAVAPQQPGHPVDQRRVGELGRVDVDRHPQPPVPQPRVPAGEPCAGLLQHRGGELVEQPGPRADRDEHHRRHLDAVVGPAGQRLQRADPPGHRVDDRLEVGADLPGGQRRGRRPVRAAAGRRGGRGRGRGSAPARGPCRRPWPRTSPRRRGAAGSPPAGRRGRRAPSSPPRRWPRPRPCARPARTAPAAPRPAPRPPAPGRRARRAPRTRRRRGGPACAVPSIDPRSRSTTRTSSASPTACPSASLTALKPSRSRNATDTARPSRRARSSAWVRLSRNSARLGSPVRGSWKAWWRSCSSRRRTAASSSRFSRSIATWRTSTSSTSAASRNPATVSSSTATTRSAAASTTAPASGTCGASRFSTRSDRARRAPAGGRPLPGATAAAATSANADAPPPVERGGAARGAQRELVGEQVVGDRHQHQPAAQQQVAGDVVAQPGRRDDGRRHQHDVRQREVERQRVGEHVSGRGVDDGVQHGHPGHQGQRAGDHRARSSARRGRVAPSAAAGPVSRCRPTTAATGKARNPSSTGEG